MKLVVLADAGLQEELLAHGTSGAISIKWITDPESFSLHQDADVWMDLLFEANADRVANLQLLPSGIVIVNDVTGVTGSLPSGFTRINGWPGFLRRTVAEMYCPAQHQQAVTGLMRLLNRKPAFTPDIPGFVTARVVSMVINEAYYALAEEVSSINDIDIAMKLGTNYPYGPFEWAEKIGLKKVVTLLEQLSATQDRYKPAVLLQKKAKG